MDNVISVIEDALKRKGLSASAASSLAVDNPSLIKNMKLSRGEKRYNYQSLERLAEVLGLELYFGPPRPTVVPRQIGLAESPTTSDLDKKEALRAGFLPLPFHGGSSRRGVAPVAFARSWLTALGLVPDGLSVVQIEAVPDGSVIAPGSLALVDQSRPKSGGPDLWCYRENSRDCIARLQWVEGDGVVIFAEAPDAPVRLLQRAQRLGLNTLGRVVWIGTLSNA